MQTRTIDTTAHTIIRDTLPTIPDGDVVNGLIGWWASTQLDAVAAAAVSAVDAMDVDPMDVFGDTVGQRDPSAAGHTIHPAVIIAARGNARAI